MPKENTHTNIELRSEDVQDILSRPPHWMIRSGNTVLISMIVIAFALSYFIRYPDVITGRAIVSTKTPPAYVTSKVNGRISRMHVQNGQPVKRDEIIAEMENPVPPESIARLESFLIALETAGKQFQKPAPEYLQITQLYDASADYLSLKNLLEEYSTFLRDKSSSRKLNDLEAKQRQHLKIKEITIREMELNKADIAYAHEKFEMQEQEFKLGYTTKLDFLDAQSVYNQSLKSKESLKKSMIQTELILIDFQTQIQDFLVGQNTKWKAYKDQIADLTSSLGNYIIRWKDDFTIRAPTSGQIDYLGRIKINQLVGGGDKLFAIVSPTNDYEIEVEIPSTGFGKVQIGQKVTLKLDNFPSNEYGVVNGVISGLSALPNQDTYKVKVDLTKGLVTSYDMVLKHSPEMTATAEVITEDLRLIERFFSSLSAVLKK